MRLTVAEIAAFLGMTTSGVRHIVRRHRIAPTGRIGHALTYSAAEVLLHAGAHDRLTTRRRHADGCPACTRRAVVSQ